MVPVLAVEVPLPPELGAAIAPLSVLHAQPGDSRRSSGPPRFGGRGDVAMIHGKDRMDARERSTQVID